MHGRTMNSCCLDFFGCDKFCVTMNWKKGESREERNTFGQQKTLKALWRGARDFGHVNHQESADVSRPHAQWFAWILICFVQLIPCNSALTMLGQGLFALWNEKQNWNCGFWNKMPVHTDHELELVQNTTSKLPHISTAIRLLNLGWMTIRVRCGLAKSHFFEGIGVTIFSFTILLLQDISQWFVWFNQRQLSPSKDHFGNWNFAIAKTFSTLMVQTPRETGYGSENKHSASFWLLRLMQDKWAFQARLGNRIPWPHLRWSCNAQSTKRCHRAELLRMYRWVPLYPNKQNQVKFFRMKRAE